MSPLLSTFQPLPLLPMPILSPGGAMPFVLVDVPAGDVPPVVTAAMTASATGPRVSFDCTMPVPQSDEPVVEPASAPTPPPVPAAALLASLDRSAGALITRPAVVPSSRSEKTVSTAGKDEAPPPPDKRGAEDALAAAVAVREPVFATMDPVSITPLNHYPQPVGTPTMRQISPTPVPDEAATVSMPTGSAAALKPSVVPSAPAIALVPGALASPQPGKATSPPATTAPLPVTAASIAVEPPQVRAAASKPHDVLTPFVAAKPIARWVPTKDDLPVAVPAAVAQAMQVDGPRLPRLILPSGSTGISPEPVSARPGALPPFVAEKPIARWVPTQDDLPVVVQTMQVDGPRLPGLMGPRVPAGNGAEPVVPPIFIAQKTTAEGVAVDGLDSTRSDAPNPAPTVAIMPSGVAQPVVSQSPIVELSATAVTSPELATIDRQLDLARGEAWLDMLARDIAASVDGDSRLRFGLSPERLGKLDVEVSRGDAGMSIQMTTRSDEARAIIAAAQPRLVEELRAQGTRVAGAEVSAQTTGQTGGHTGSAPRPHVASIIEAAVDARVSAEPANTTAPAAGRYA